MTDTVIKLGESVIQHGKENDRVYLMKLSMNDMPQIIVRINELAADFGYTKIFAKIQDCAFDAFKNDGYIEEAYIPNFFSGLAGCHFMGKFLSERRKQDMEAAISQKVLKAALNKIVEKPPALPAAFSARKVVPGDAEEMAALYRKVFKTYPFPIDDKNYIQRTMADHVVYFGVWHYNVLVALSSCELSIGQSNAEMTDFAVLPSCRGKKLALHLLGMMEDELRTLTIHTAYTIARANSFGMNTTFSKAGYAYAGKLINNTNIGGHIESMNVWYKPIL